MAKQRLRRSHAVIILILLMQTGCLGLKTADVRFEDPLLKLGITQVEAIPEEAQGVMLRILPPDDSIIRSVEEMVHFSRIKEKRGLQISVVQEKTDEYLPGPTPDTFRLISKGELSPDGGRTLDDVIMSHRGEIKTLNKAERDTKLGKTTITSWSKSAVFPEGPVKVGDSWSYNEVMDLNLQSMLVKRTHQTPERLHAESTLTGFATVQGRRCAVIRTTATKTSSEELKVLFKTVRALVETEIEETSYLDYEQGQIIAKITSTESTMAIPDVGMEDKGRGQSIYYQIRSEQTPEPAG